MLAGAIQSRWVCTEEFGEILSSLNIFETKRVQSMVLSSRVLAGVHHRDFLSYLRRSAEMRVATITVATTDSLCTATVSLGPRSRF